LPLRLEALGLGLAEAWRAAAPPSVPAVTLLNHPTAIDRDLTTMLETLSAALRVVRQAAQRAERGQRTRP
jgi:hypothetical protein